MRKIILYIAQSIDGMIADNGGGVDWLGGEDEIFTGDYGYQQMIDEVDTIILGYTTYHQVKHTLSPDSWPYSGKSCYVLTHHPLSDEKDITFTDKSPADLVKKLRAEDGKAVWICGGASVASQLASADLIDEYHLCTMPVILGSGIRLFDTLPSSISLHLEESKAENGVVRSRYTRR